MLSNTDVQTKEARDGFLLQNIGSKIEYLEVNSSRHHMKSYIYLGGSSKSTRRIMFNTCLSMMCF